MRNKPHNGFAVRYADVDYLGIEHCDAEYLNGVWYYERRIGEVYAFPQQSRVRLLNDLQVCPRHNMKVGCPPVRLFGMTPD
jgi:hypothetical protein